MYGARWTCGVALDSLPLTRWCHIVAWAKTLVSLIAQSLATAHLMKRFHQCWMHLQVVHKTYATIDAKPTDGQSYRWLIIEAWIDGYLQVDSRIERGFDVSLARIRNEIH